MSDIKIIGLEQVQAKLSKIEQSLTGSQMTTRMHTIGDILKGSIERSFEEEKSPFGVPWTPLKAATLKAKAKKAERSSILQSSGSLADYWVVQASPTEVTVSNNTVKDYGAVHQFGSKKTSGRGSGIPARPFLPIDSNHNMEPGAQNIILKYLDDEIKKMI